MKSCQGNIPQDSLSLFASDIGSGEFFSYVGNLVIKIICSFFASSLDFYF